MGYWTQRMRAVACRRPAYWRRRRCAHPICPPAFAGTAVLPGSHGSPPSSSRGAPRAFHAVDFLAPSSPLQTARQCLASYPSPGRTADAAASLPSCLSPSAGAPPGFELSHEPVGRVWSGSAGQPSRLHGRPCRARSPLTSRRFVACGGCMAWRVCVLTTHTQNVSGTPGVKEDGRRCWIFALVTFVE